MFPNVGKAAKKELTPLQNECFWGYTGIRLSVSPPMYSSVFKILVSVKALPVY